jgi:hypothetical protein
MYLATNPPKRRHSLGNTFLIGRDDLAQILRVHVGGECGRTDEVREHHCDLAAFGRVLGLLLRSGGGLRCHLGRIYVLADSGKYLPSGSKRDAHLLQILIGQMG